MSITNQTNMKMEKQYKNTFLALKIKEVK